MKRKDFLKNGLAIGAFGAIGTGRTQKQPEVQSTSNKKYEWKMTTTWGKNFPVVGEGCNRLAERIRVMSNGRLDIRVYGAGELIPPMESFSAVEFVDQLAGKTDAASAEEGTSLTYASVPTREYTGLKMYIGVPTSVNATAPNSYDSGSPLANTGEYWEGWSSNIFHKIEGRIDDTSGSGSFETALALHIGSDAAF